MMDDDVIDIRYNIADGKYTSGVVVELTPNENKRRDAYKLWKEDQDRLNAEFKRDLLAALGLTNHPRADRFYELCWEAGHASGLYEVLQVAETWADILRS